MESQSTKSGSIFKLVWKIFSTVVVALVVLLAVLLGGVRIFGFKPYAVLSPSMTPHYKVGSLVYVQKAEPNEIKKGEVITFVAGIDKTVVTHRVFDVDRTNGCIYTKGDANRDVDESPVAFENVLGRVRFSIPLIGYISILLMNTSGRYLILAGFFLLCVLLLLPEVIKTFKKE